MWANDRVHVIKLRLMSGQIYNKEVNNSRTYSDVRKPCCIFLMEMKCLAQFFYCNNVFLITYYYIIGSQMKIQNFTIITRNVIDTALLWHNRPDNGRGVASLEAHTIKQIT